MSCHTEYTHSTCNSKDNIMHMKTLKVPTVWYVGQIETDVSYQIT